MSTKPFQATSGTGIAHPGPKGRYGKGPIRTLAPQQTQGDSPDVSTQADAQKPSTEIVKK